MISLDTSGLQCPLPYLKLRKVIKGFAPGTWLEVLATDPLAPGDFRELCEAFGHRYVETRHDGTVSRTVVVVGGGHGDR